MTEHLSTSVSINGRQYWKEKVVPVARSGDRVHGLWNIRESEAARVMWKNR